MSSDENTQEMKLHNRVIEKLKLIFEEVTLIEAENIDSKEPFESYDVDSLTVLQLNAELECVFKDLPKTLFYEEQILEDVASFLISNYRLECENWVMDDLDDESDEFTLSADEIEKEDGSPVLKPIENSQDKEANNIKDVLYEPIAIIGISGRYPQGETIEDFWENIKYGRDCISKIPPNRWSYEEHSESDKDEAVKQRKSNCKHGGFLEGFSEFDPLFFNISPKEAYETDPQERLFLEVCWETIEEAGYTRERVREKADRSVGVFVGATQPGHEIYGTKIHYENTTLFVMGEAVMYLGKQLVRYY